MGQIVNEFYGLDKKKGQGLFHDEDELNHSPIHDEEEETEVIDDTVSNLGRFEYVQSSDDLDSMEEVVPTDDEVEDANDEAGDDGKGNDNVTPEEYGFKTHTKKGKKNNIYCDKKELYEEIRKYQVDGNATNKLGELIIKLAIHISTMGRFYRYSHAIKEELVQHAILQMLISVPKFDLKNEKANPFGYLSMIAYRDMLHTLKKYFKQDKIRDELSGAYYTKLSENVGDERLGMLKQTLERNEEYNTFLKNERKNGEKQVDTFALSRAEQERRYKESLKKQAKTVKSSK